MANINRRLFMRGAGATGFLGGAQALGLMGTNPAFAADTSGYKALVCLFFFGGMDHADTVLPFDQESLDQLTGHRQGLYDARQGISPRIRDNMVQLNPVNASAFGGRQFALPSELGPLASLFNSGDMSIVGGVGPLIEPVTRDDIELNRRAVPTRLFSHNDQQSTWMSGQPEGASRGWGGQFADAVLASAPSDNESFASITTGSNEVFLSADTARPFRVTANGTPGVTMLQPEQEFRLGFTEGADIARRNLDDFINGQGLSPDNLYMRDFLAANNRSLDKSAELNRSTVNTFPFQTQFPNNRTGQSFLAVARTISIQQSLNVSRQVFFVPMFGFDTHSEQAENLTRLHLEMAESLVAFRSALLEMNMWNNVTTFTAADFGRTIVDNGDGTDHGWGGHHFVMGGAVQGQRIFGDLADFDLAAPYYSGNSGRLIPSIAVDQYAATLGSWFGLTQGELAQIFPNLGNFNTSNLGFLG